MAAALGLVALAAAMKLGYRRLARLAYPLLFMAMLALALVLIPGIGTSIGGARRWIRFPGFSVQPAELEKARQYVYLCASCGRCSESCPREVDPAGVMAAIGTPKCCATRALSPASPVITPPMRTCAIARGLKVCESTPGEPIAA